MGTGALEDEEQEICNLQSCAPDFMFWNRIGLSMGFCLYKSVFTEPDPEWDDMEGSG
ncbi:hypothetical protein ANBU17_06800 [Anaerostipes butyraticus]|uniref:Uncharacterized protein n=1 Tax=Anaerostipes butyraticus TaxID=645466 RepID=A0A916Q987_9FIRM|nr:hypothetical protein ANBU17_06800 [Anaerostipes butyraticus]